MRIKRLNEDIDSDYIIECFIDLIDNGAEYESDYEILNKNQTQDYESLFDIFIDIPELSFHAYDGLLEGYVKNVKEKLDSYNNTISLIENAVEKVRIKYGNVSAIITPEDETCIHIEIIRDTD